MPNPWPKGVSGNPHGRPRKGNSFSDLLEKELKKRKYTIREEDGSDRKVNGKQAIIRIQLALIFSKTTTDEVKIRAIDSLIDRVDGRPRQTQEVQFTEDLPRVVIEEAGDD